ncbi:universal stress protein [Cellulomonas soli]|uniref:universal stress protein n=1 Tax=Cellulomonas soli TaxID=931535 RepID=UPI003F8488DA
MPTPEVPQPGPSRMVPVAGHPLVVGVVPGQPALVALTAAEWARAAGASELCCAFVDGSRYTRAEHEDGSVQHEAIDPDGADDGWLRRQELIEQSLAEVLADCGVPWTFRYLAGRADRALTHLARAVDAAGFVVGTRSPGAGARVREAIEGSVAVRLTHHQHRPVMVVPLHVVDWKTPLLG